MSQNSEPNTGNDWRYVWDDAGRLVGTSDARGCGKNIHYDGLGRVVGEDYSPCLLSQPDYSPPDEATGEGFETFYRYDTYEPGQLESEPGFNESTGFAKGQLVSVQDRGSHTRFNYDSRSRTRRVSRRIIKPLDFALKGTSRYAAHWYKKRIDYDLAGRPVRQTTGADIDEFLINDKSEETISYDSRGFPKSVGSSYGDIVTDTQYDIDGSVSYAVYGDAAATSIVSERDDRRRLTRRTIKRSHSSLWDASTSTYPLPGPDTTLEVLADYSFPTNEIDDVGNPKVIEDWTPYDATFPAHAAPVRRREIAYDDLYRVTAIDYTYALASGGSGGAPFASPYAAEVSAGDRRPIPLREPKGRERIRSQKFDYDVLGNIRSARGDEDLPYDRTLGTVLHGMPGEGPNQLQQADGVRARYDKAGNLVELKIERSGSVCPSGPGSSHCAQWLAYDWDEVGHLVRGRRWDFVGPLTPPLPPETLPSGPPTWDLAYAYTMGLRTLKSAADEVGTTKHTLEVFDSLRIDRTEYVDLSEDYERDRDRVRAFLAGGVAQVIYDSTASLPRPNPKAPPLHVFFSLGDHLGSSSIVIDRASSELVERTTYAAYGSVESEFRPERWGAFRDAYKFTSKEEDIELGLSYFGARYYQSHLASWASADPLTVHGLGSDLNPYAYVAGRIVSFIDPFGLAGAPGPDGPGPPVPVPGTSKNGGTTTTTTCDPCVGDSTTMERMEDASGRRLEVLYRTGGGLHTAVPHAAPRGNWLGEDPGVGDDMRNADGTVDPDWQRGKYYAAGIMAVWFAWVAVEALEVAAPVAIFRMLSRAAPRAAPAIGAAGAAGAAGGQQQACSPGGCATALRFGARDLVYGPSAGGALRQLQQQAGGRLLTDVGGPGPGQSWTDFSTDTLRQQVFSGGVVRFDLTNIQDLPGVLAGTGPYANTVTAIELRYIQQNWSTMFQGNVFFYMNGAATGVPW